MFQFRRFPSYAYFIQRRILEYCSSGFPHSEISGSKAVCASPKLIAACHVLHRLLMPRHSPCALISLTSSAWTSYRALPPSAKACSLRHASSPFKAETALNGFKGNVADTSHPQPYGPLNKWFSRIMQASELFWLHCFYPLWSFDLCVSTILLYSVACSSILESFTLFSFQGAPSNLC